MAEGTLASAVLAVKSPQADLDTFAENDPVRSVTALGVCAERVGDAGLALERGVGNAGDWRRE